MPTPTEPPRESKRPWARARTGAPEGLRPEVAAALAGLERSIGEVAAREHDAAGGAALDDAAAAPGPPAVSAPLDVGVDAAPTPALSGLELNLPGPSWRDGVLPGAAPELDLDLDLGSLMDRSATQDSGAFWAAAEVGGAGRSLSKQDRRRRSGRILSWTGAALLVAVAAWLLLPGSTSNKADDSTRTTSTEASTTSTTVSSNDGSSFPVSTTALAVPDTTPTTAVPSTVTTVKRRVVTTTVRPTATTQPPIITTTTVQPTTTTTIAPETTTTCAIGGIPDPQHGTC